MKGGSRANPSAIPNGSRKRPRKSGEPCLTAEIPAPLPINVERVLQSLRTPTLAQNRIKVQDAMSELKHEQVVASWKKFEKMKEVVACMMPGTSIRPATGLKPLIDPRTTWGTQDAIDMAVSPATLRSPENTPTGAEEVERLLTQVTCAKTREREAWKSGDTSLWLDINMVVNNYRIRNGDFETANTIKSLNQGLIGLMRPDEIYRTDAATRILTSLERIPEPTRRAWCAQTFGNPDISNADLEEHLEKTQTTQVRAEFKRYNCKIDVEPLVRQFQFLDFECPLKVDILEDFVYDREGIVRKGLMRHIPDPSQIEGFLELYGPFQRAILAHYSCAIEDKTQTIQVLGIPIKNFHSAFGGPSSGAVDTAVKGTENMIGLPASLLFPRSRNVPSCIDTRIRHSSPSRRKNKDVKENTDEMDIEKVVFMRNYLFDDAEGSDGKPSEWLKVEDLDFPVGNRSSGYARIVDEAPIVKEYSQMCKETPFSVDSKEGRSMADMAHEEIDSHPNRCPNCFGDVREHERDNRIVPVHVIPFFLSKLPEPYFTLNGDIGDVTKCLLRELARLAADQMQPPDEMDDTQKFECTSMKSAFKLTDMGDSFFRQMVSKSIKGFAESHKAILQSLQRVQQVNDMMMSMILRRDEDLRSMSVQLEQLAQSQEETQQTLSAHFGIATGKLAMPKHTPVRLGNVARPAVHRDMPPADDPPFNLSGPSGIPHNPTKVDSVSRAEEIYKRRTSRRQEETRRSKAHHDQLKRLQTVHRQSENALAVELKKERTPTLEEQRATSIPASMVSLYKLASS